MNSFHFDKYYTKLLKINKSPILLAEYGKTKTLYLLLRGANICTIIIEKFRSFHRNHVSYPNIQFQLYRDGQCKPSLFFY